jgi:hypothetical protein
MVGVWIDHKKAVIVSSSQGHITTKTLESDVAAHPHFSGQQDGGGEKKYEERHRRSLEQYYDEVVNHLGKPEALLIFGPGEAKLELKERLGRSGAPSRLIVEIEATDKLTDPQIVEKVKEHFSTTN